MSSGLRQSTRQTRWAAMQTTTSRITPNHRTQPKKNTASASVEVAQPTLQYQTLNNPHSSPPLSPPQTIRFIDLFAGIGGMRLGFEAIGGQCVFTSEWDVHAAKTYAANFGESPNGDITQIPTQAIPEFDVLVAGFPCQPFSSIGKRQGFLHATQGTLFYDVVRILQAKQPRAFLLENVQGLVTHNQGETFKTIISTLRGLGYVVHHKILDASDYGVPQLRKRIYIVGYFPDKCSAAARDFCFPAAQGQKVGVGQFLEQGVSGYAISEHLQKSYLFKVNDGRPLIVDRNTTTPSKTLVATYHKIQRLTGTFVRDEVTGLRLLSQNECKALMGFPKDFIVPVSRTQMYRQFGNSVAVPVIQAIAKSIKETILK